MAGKNSQGDGRGRGRGKGRGRSPTVSVANTNKADAKAFFAKSSTSAASDEKEVPIMAEVPFGETEARNSSSDEPAVPEKRVRSRSKTSSTPSALKRGKSSAHLDGIAAAPEQPDGQANEPQGQVLQAIKPLTWFFVFGVLIYILQCLNK